MATQGGREERMRLLRLVAVAPLALSSVYSVKLLVFCVLRYLLPTDWYTTTNLRDFAEARYVWGILAGLVWAIALLLVYARARSAFTRFIAVLVGSLPFCVVCFIEYLRGSWETRVAVLGAWYSLPLIAVHLWLYLHARSRSGIGQGRRVGPA